MFLKYISMSFLVMNLVGCAYLHSVQLGSVDAAVVEKGRRFEVMVSQLGINLDEAGGIAASAARSNQDQQNIQSIAAIIALFQMGPRTGNPVYSDTYADQIYSLLRKECPSGQMTGLSSIRETAKYPVVSGEIVKITGYCL